MQGVQKRVLESLTRPCHAQALANALRDSVGLKLENEQCTLTQGVEVNAEDSTGATPLADAIRCGRREEQAALRGAGGRLGASDIAERLCVAAAANDLDTLNVRHTTIWASPCQQQLTAHMHGAAKAVGRSCTRPPTCITCPYSQVLAENGVDMGACDPDGCTALHVAAACGRAEAACLLLSLPGADVRPSPLRTAC